jgi:radical SAM protein with 4Fe4S-binding SPASM domain
LPPRESELTTSELERVIDQFVEAGGMWLNFSGGEIFYRRDFLELYTYAKRKGVFIALLTNGTMITERVADVLAEYPPRVVEITLYGATAETFDRLTGVPGAFARCMEGIRLLRERGLPVRLKTVLMRENAHEFDEMQALARELAGDERFRYDAMIFPRLDRSTGSCHSRLSPEEIVDLDASSEERREGWSRFVDANYGLRVEGDDLFQCGAGRSTFYIGPDGALYPCIMMREIRLDLHGRIDDFRVAYDEINEQIRTARRSTDTKCASCPQHSFCDQCPGWTSLVHGEADVRAIDFLCQVTTLRAERFRTKKETAATGLVQITRAARGGALS